MSRYDEADPVPGQRPHPEDEAVEDLTPEQIREAAAARRKARKAARAHAPAPERDPAYDALSLDGLRELRASLADEETRVSYWRRIIQARLDVLRAGGPAVDRVADLSRVLSDAPTMRRRLAHLSVGPVDDVPPLPDLARLWSREVEGDEAAREALAADLLVAERRLSEVRAGLFRRIDGATGELIARYREDPALALTALPHEAISLRV